MYSRYHGGEAREIRVPENYGGCAFADAPRETAWTPPPRALEVAKPSLPTQELPKPQPEDEAPTLASEPPEVEVKAEERSAPEKCDTLPTLFKKSRLLESFGFEELLLIGLILLLSESGADSETLLWLGLLLLCG